ncbi:MAG: polysaccharide deacetylase family protein [Limnochordaceae bacterium]|nr:polysaccharide deacetylase family protein [Limnochordaceae bacterium]
MVALLSGVCPADASGHPAPRAGARGPALILMYHRVAPASAGGATGLRVEPRMLDAQIRYLQRHGYHLVPLGRLVRQLCGEEPLVPRTVAITFDDGYEELFRYAWPILRARHAPATIFVVAGLSANRWERARGYPRKPLLGDRELQRMVASGLVEVGSHTLTHPHLARIRPDQAWYEIHRSRELLETRIGRPVRLFSYPYGELDPTLRAMVEQAGYVAAVSTIQGIESKPVRDCFTLHRIRVLGSYRLADFALALSRPVDLSSPARHSTAAPGRRGAHVRPPETYLREQGGHPVVQVQGEPRRRELVLTVDGAPDPKTTPAILDVLDRLGVRAIFFVVGSRAERYPSLVAAIAQEGHLIGVHPYEERDLTTLSDAGIYNELVNSRMVVRAMTGRVPHLFRPLPARWNSRVVQAARAAAFTTVLWTARIRTDLPLDQAVRRAVGQARQGAIVAVDGRRRSAPVEIERIVDGLRAQGYRWVTARAWR